MSGVKGHRTHALVRTEAGGMVEMPSLARVENVDAASPTAAFTGFTIDKKSNASLHAVLWAPSPASSKRQSIPLSSRRRPGMRTALVTTSVLGLILIGGTPARSDQASAQS